LSKDIRERGFVVGLYSLSKRLLLVPALMVLALWGAWRIREQWKASLPLFMIPLGVMLGYVPFTMESGRYALAVLPCVLILAVAGVVSWIMSRKNSRDTSHHGRLMWGQRSS
jgi:4-amino-4-deoxy-L-arabinose transferase-like glycosyltransferase